MKTLFVACLIAVYALSCKKDPDVIRLPPQLVPPKIPQTSPPYSSLGPGYPLPPFGAIHDSLSGREYTFTDLTWKGEADERYIFVELPTTKLLIGRGIDVFIDSSATEIEVPFYTVEYPEGTFPYPPNKGYVYDNSYFENVFVFAVSASNRNLVGTNVSIRVKVL